jgi:hypothetical protein
MSDMRAQQALASPSSGHPSESWDLIFLVLHMRRKRTLAVPAEAASFEQG